MARIAGVDIPRDKRVVISLTYVFGIGRTTAEKILAEAGISEETRVRDLTEDELDVSVISSIVLKLRETFVVKYLLTSNV